MDFVQNGMDFKIVDLDYLMVFYAREYNFREQRAKWTCLHVHLATAVRARQSMAFCGLSGQGKADEEFRLADVAVISSILKEARKVDDVPPFVYPCGRQSDRMELQEDEWER